MVDRQRSSRPPVVCVPRSDVCPVWIVCTAILNLHFSNVFWRSKGTFVFGSSSPCLLSRRPTATKSEVAIQSNGTFCFFVAVLGAVVVFVLGWRNRFQFCGIVVLAAIVGSRQLLLPPRRPNEFDQSSSSGRKEAVAAVAATTPSATANGPTPSSNTTKTTNTTTPTAAFVVTTNTNNTRCQHQAPRTT
jgi:hypothetical protein